VHLVLDEGDGGNRIEVAAVDRGGDLRLAIRLAAGDLSPGVPFDWSAGGTFRIERTAAGDARVLVESGARDEVAHADLPASGRPGIASFEFGCASLAAVATASF